MDDNYCPCCGAGYDDMDRRRERLEIASRVLAGMDKRPHDPLNDAYDALKWADCLIAAVDAKP